MPGNTTEPTPGDVPAGAATAVLEEASRLAATDPGAALTLLDALERTFQDAAPNVRAAVSYLRARIVLDGGDPVTALKLIDAAREGYLAAGLRLAALRTELGRMHALDDLGRHEDAATAGRRLLDELGDGQPSADPLVPDEVHALRAAAEGNLGAALGFLGRHEEAVEAYRRSEVSWRASGAFEQAAAALANQGIELTELGRPGAAIERLEAAAAVFDAADDRAWFAKCLAHRGEAMAAAGWLADAVGDFRRARATLSELGAATEAWRVAIMTASTLTGLGLSDEALAIIDAVEPEVRAAGLRHDLATALAAKGMAASRAGFPARARAALAEAVEVFAEVHDPANTARALLGEAALIEDDDEARALARRAADLLRSGNWPGMRCLVALRLAELAVDDTEAAALTDEAARLADDLALPHVRQAVSLHQGTLLLRLGDLDGGIERLSRSLAEVEQIGARIHDDLLRAAYLNSCSTAQDALVTGLLQRGRPADLTRAAALSDRARARTLSESMRASGADRPSASEPDAALWEELQAAYSALFAADARNHPSLRATVTDLERELSLRRALAAGPGAPPDLLRPHRPASSGVTTLAYHLSANEVVAFVSTAAGTQVRRHVTDRHRVTALLEDLEAHLGGHAVPAIVAFPQARAQACREVLRELYLAVFAPVVELLPPVSDPPAPLLVVPHGPLHRIPFHALFDGTGYLVRDWVISVSPSIEVAQLAAARTPRSGPALVVGVADEGTSFVEHEARTVAEVHPGARVLIGSEATLAAVRSAAVDAGVVHLACHGLFRGENVAFSSFRLADRWVGARDIASFALDGAVLVLSACESGRSGTGGELASGLARGFLATGARSVVVSQWLADDRCTAGLMVDLHHHLAAGDDPATALRAAQLATIESHPHPFHWAPFVAVGAPSLREVT